MGRTLTNLGVVALAVSFAAPVEAQWSTEALSTPRRGAAVTTIGGRAIFAGGIKNNLRSARVDIYDSTSGAWTFATLLVPRGECAATSVGPYALIAGGYTNSGTASSVVDVLDVRTMTWSTTLLPLGARYFLAATTVGTKTLFAGGGTGPLGAPVGSNHVDIYDSSVGPPSDADAWSTAQISVPRGAMGVASVGSLALFAGGYDATTVFDRVDVYDDTTGLWTTTSLSQARMFISPSSATVGSRCYFGGGLLGPNGPASDVVDIYDAQTGFLSSARLSVPRSYVSVAAVGDTVLFAGGLKGPASASELVDTLHASSGLWSVAPSLSSARWWMGAASVGGKALFAGGGVNFPGPQASAAVDVYDGTVGTRYCSPGVVNSSGRPGTLTAFGSEAALANDLTLSAFELPPSAFGFFLTSIAQGFVANPAGSQGNLCLSGAIGRYVGTGQVQDSGASGSFSLVLDLAQTPTPGGSVSIVAGETWNFQAWHRDANPTLTSNFTDAASVLFR